MHSCVVAWNFNSRGPVPHGRGVRGLGHLTIRTACSQLIQPCHTSSLASLCSRGRKPPRLAVCHRFQGRTTHRLLLLPMAEMVGLQSRCHRRRFFVATKWRLLGKSCQTGQVPLKCIDLILRRHSRPSTTLQSCLADLLIRPWSGLHQLRTPQYSRRSGKQSKPKQLLHVRSQVSRSYRRRRQSPT